MRLDAKKILLHVNNKGTDHPTHPRSLISPSVNRRYLIANTSIHVYFSLVYEVGLLANRGVSEGKMKVRRGCVWKGVSPSLTLEKKSRYEQNGGFSCIF